MQVYKIYYLMKIKVQTCKPMGQGNLKLHYSRATVKVVNKTCFFVGSVNYVWFFFRFLGGQVLKRNTKHNSEASYE